MSCVNVPSLVEDAIKAKAHSHTPYLKKPVGCAIATDKGVVTGSTFENCAYPNSICATRCAVVNAVSSGATKFHAVAISGWRENLPANICGVCRECLSEFGDVKIYLHLAGTEKNYIATNLATLLPRAGSPDGFGAISATAFTLNKRNEGLEGLKFEGFELAPSQSESEENISLMKAAIKACEGAYIPVSHFPVGAAVITDAGLFTGANVESEVLGIGLCAERTALAKAVAGGAKKVHKLAVTCFKLPDFGRPCGGCRQNLVEFGEFPIFQIRVDQDSHTFTFEPKQTSFSILPNCFSPSALE